MKAVKFGFGNKGGENYSLRGAQVSESQPTVVMEEPDCRVNIMLHLLVDLIYHAFIFNLYELVRQR